MHAEVTMDKASERRVLRGLDGEKSGRRLREDLAKEFDEALGPAQDEVKGALFAMSDGGLPTAGEPLRQAVAAHIITDVHLGANSARVSIRALKDGMPRDFWNAPKRLNQRSWRRRVYGRDVWVTQIGAPGWFDDTLHRHETRYRLAARRALDKMAERIGRGS